jgi:hypothetical protein
MYALQLSKGNGFQECFDKLYDLLSEDELVGQALEKLNYPSKWKNKHKTRDLINAFSEVYNEEFYDEATFADLFDSNENHLSDVILGASEFTYGIQFRLQEEHDGGRFGNRFLNLPEETAKEVRIADAVASSSCFPGGFEPMIMPTDFGNGPDSLVNRSWYSKSFDDTPYPTTAVMDGGIIDNQGIEGVKLAEKRRARDGDPFIGTYLVSDVSSNMMDPYKVPIMKYSSWKNFFTLRGINYGLIILTLVLSFYLYKGMPFWGIIASSAVLTLSALWFFIYFILRNALKNGIESMVGESMMPDLMHDLKVLHKTPLYILLYLVKFRLSSVIKMAMDVFLRRIRRLELNALYDSSDWDYRFKSNYIYSLENDKSLPASMQKIIKASNSMPTTLWFSAQEKKDGVLNDLIACGQLTMCYNLIKYTDRIQSVKYKKKVWDPLSPENKKSILDLKKSMKADWKKFENDPYWLLRKETGMEDLNNTKNRA